MLTPDRRRGPQWLDVCRHRVRAVAAPYLVVLQHHIVRSPTLIVAPLVPSKGEPATVLSPHLRVGTIAYRAMLLNLTSVAQSEIGNMVASAEPHADAIANALDAIFRGYPVGLPL